MRRQVIVRSLDERLRRLCGGSDFGHRHGPLFLGLLYEEAEGVHETHLLGGTAADS